ncbi:MAG: hypothetical protein RRB13_08470 [bacterium]|nr:hypothetical protein [bacterium]
MKFKLILCLLLLVFTAPLMAQSVVVDQRDQFRDIENLIKLIEKARENGLSDEEIKQLNLREQGGDINVMEYIEAFRLKKRLKDQKLQAFLEKRFLTVTDIFNELVNMEPEQLEKLREELTSDY